MSDAAALPAVLEPKLSSLTNAGHWYLAYSGGLDSTVLLQLLCDWRDSHPDSPPLTAVHVNHGLQEAADDWQRHCAHHCEQLDVPLLAHSVDVTRAGQGLESAARDGRYQVFEGLLDDNDVLFMAHHLDDQVETFFLRLMRGAGAEGLAAMPAQRPLGKGQLVRPLLSLSREQLRDYTSERALAFIEDPSNLDPAFDRNYLRSQVLPLLRERWPAYRASVSRAAEHLGDVVDLLSREGAVLTTCHNAWGDVGFSLEELASEQRMACQQLRAWLRARALPMPDQASLQEFIRQLQQGDETGHPRLDCGAYRLQRYRQAVYQVPPDLPEGMPQSRELGPGESVRVPGVGSVSLLPTTGRGLGLHEGETVTLDWRRHGERCRIVDKGHSSSVKQFLQESGVPPWWRQRMPMLYRDGQLLAIADLALCQTPWFQERALEGEKNWELSFKPESSGLRV